MATPDLVRLERSPRSLLSLSPDSSSLTSTSRSVKRFPERFKEYDESLHHPKITIMADDDQLRELYKRYKQKFGTAIITDAGRTVFDGPTLTCVGIGPILPSEREEILTNLRPW